MVTSTPFNGSSDVYEWLCSFINVERGHALKNFCLDRMEAMAKMTGNPENCAPVIHVAGSKGKGSVTGMIASILEASGKKVAIYASPHVSDFRERLRCGSGFFDEEIYIKAGNELKALTDRLEMSSYRDLDGIEPSHFELLTLWFFLCARLAKAEVMAIETGMGGRLDATNIVDPLVLVITLIELEHTEFLGTTIPAIAGEKAGIIKPGRPLVLAAQKPEALEVFKDHSERKGSPLYYLPECIEIKDVINSREGTSFSYAEKDPAGKVCLSLNDLHIKMPGEVQVYNAGLAILAVRKAYPYIDSASIKKGLAAFSLPARFEKIMDKPVFIIDAAHTKKSMEQCVKTFTGFYGSGAVLVFGCVAGKDLASMAETCVPCFSTVIITKPGTYRQSYPEEIYETFLAESKKQNVSIDLRLIPETESAVDTAIKLALEKKLPLLGAGSFYLAGEIRKRKL